MGSLKGDTIVMRNGHSTSQISIYNYPEHLNPFYEDDQHKRLRFFKITNRYNEGRRNSFSMANLKDMWVFKSFRMNKKSSTLGINKASESPPLLRREYVLDNGWNTFDCSFRGRKTSYINSAYFQRNATYRSSLQTLPITSERIGLNRNDGHRSTIQVSGTIPCYQPPEMQHQLQRSMGKRRSSKSSMVSTNPFESDDDDNENINTRGMKSVKNDITTIITPRKKRQAPAPPIPILGSSTCTSSPTITHMDPSHDIMPDELRIEENIEIANLTAEIESFVKIKNNGHTPKNHDQISSITNTVSKNLLSNEQKISAIDVEVKNEMQEKNHTSKNASLVVRNKNDIDTLLEERVNDTAKRNGYFTTALSSAVDSIESLRKMSSTQISREIVTETDKSKEDNTNGGMAKKQTKNSIVSPADMQNRELSINNMCNKEIHTEESQYNPIPFKREMKMNAEVGHVECIHIHVENSTVSLSENQNDSTSSFEKTEKVERPELITIKTPFVLVSPSAQKKRFSQAESRERVVNETVKIEETEAKLRTVNNGLNIEGERMNARLRKPVLIPMQIAKDLNENFTEIHRPLRKNTQRNHILRTSRDGKTSPSDIYKHESKENERKINNIADSQANNTNSEKLKSMKTTHFEPTKNLKIVETLTNDISWNLKKIQEPLKQVERNDDDLTYRPKPSSHMEWKHSTLAPLETNIPPEKRKSVKDIIESINRSQRLLNAAANKDFTVLNNQNTIKNTNDPESITTFPFPANQNNNLNGTQNQRHHFVEETAPSDEDFAGAIYSHSVNNNERKGANKLNNGEIFQKCKVSKEVYDYRESSPITANLDWNPVPKPKRTKSSQE